MGKAQDNVHISWQMPFYCFFPGYVGGSHYSHSGANANYLCLVRDPLWGKDDDAATDYGDNS